METRGQAWFDASELNDACPVPRTDRQWIKEVLELWGARYEQRVATAALRQVTQDDATYLLDVDQSQGWSRTVVAVARLHAPELARDRSYQAGFPLPPPLERERDRGHLIPNEGAGKYGPNLFLQDRPLNRGWSFEGRLFRAMERRAVSTQALYFCGLDYCDNTEMPAVVTAGVLDEHAAWIVDVYRNRFDQTARAAYPDSARPTHLDSVLRYASTATVGDLGEEVARSYLENAMGQLIVDLDDALLPRPGVRHGVDIVAVDGGELVAYEVKTRLRAKRRRTRNGDLVRPRLERAKDGRQASQRYMLQRLTDVIPVDPDTSVTVRCSLSTCARC